MNDSVVQHHIVLTPGMVISWLPRNATPAQQDSAVQSRFKASEIRWSTRAMAWRVSLYPITSIMTISLHSYCWCCS